MFENHTKKYQKNVARFACETILSDFETMCQSQTRMCEISGEKEVTILKMHQNISLRTEKKCTILQKKTKKLYVFPFYLLLNSLLNTFSFRSSIRNNTT